MKVLAPAALAHRVSLRPELWVRGVRTEQVIDQCLASVPVPPPDEPAPPAAPAVPAPLPGR